jgi:hypothetical protein
VCCALSCAAIIFIVKYEVHLNNTSRHGARTQVFVLLRVITLTQMILTSCKKETSRVLSGDNDPKYEFNVLLTVYYRDVIC